MPPFIVVVVYNYRIAHFAEVFLNQLAQQVKLNILTGNSGSGKSMLLQALDLYCSRNDLNWVFCNYHQMNYAKEKLIDICSNKDVVLLDNADLYITEDILNRILKTSKMVVMSLHDISAVSTNEAAIIQVIYTNDLRLSIRKL